MRRTTSVGSIVGGLLLILAGVLFLLQSLNLVAISWEAVIGPLFGLGGIVFLSVYLQNRQNWWALIPGFVLLGIGTLIFLDFIAPGLNDRWGGLIFLGALGLSFWIIYLTNRAFWWAIIPGGVLVTLGLVSSLGQEQPMMGGGAFFLGLALTFGLLYLLPSESGRMTWALYPALVLGIFALLLFIGATVLLDYANLIWPIALILLGLYLVFVWVRRSSRNI